MYLSRTVMTSKDYLLSGASSLAGKLFDNVSLQKMLFNALRLNRKEVRRFILDRDAAFLAYCLARRSRSKSQILQDLWVCFELGEKIGGYFVEFGATNGRKNSNTWLLEKHWGGRGFSRSRIPSGMPRWRPSETPRSSTDAFRLGRTRRSPSSRPTTRIPN